MRRSTEFDATVKHGVRTVQPDVVVYVRRENDVCGQGAAPRVGLIIAKSVGSAVERHRVARRLRHVTRNFLSELGGSERVVIRALPSSRTVSSARLAQEVRRGLGCALASAGMKS